jgi:hypothetical protein
LQEGASRAGTDSTFDAKANQRCHKVGEFPVSAAFKKSTFIYGTMGKGSVIVRGLKTWAAKAPIECARSCRSREADY